MGFTLIELLVVMSVIVILTGLLIPMVTSARRNAKIVATRNLIAQIESANESYSESMGAYCPDKIDGGTALVVFNRRIDTNTDGEEVFTYIAFNGSDLASGVSTDIPGNCVSSAEALYYFLANPFVTSNSPFLDIESGSQTSDLNSNGVHEVLDAWQRPVLYNRWPFRDEDGNTVTAFNYAEPNGTLNNPNGFDLFAIIPSRRTGGISVKEPTESLEDYNAEALDVYGGPGTENVIANW